MKTCFSFIRAAIPICSTDCIWNGNKRPLLAESEHSFSPISDRSNDRFGEKQTFAFFLFCGEKRGFMPASHT
jgi:hypothetical protein